MGKTYIDRNKRVREEKTEHYRVDCRESMFNFLEQQVYTRDTIQLRVNALMYYRIVHVKLQMLAERNRRAAFIVAEGQKSAMRKESEGVRVEKYQMGVAEQEATRRLSEGEAE